MKALNAFRLVLTAGILCFASNAFADSTFIKFGSSWTYLDNGSDPGTGWKETSAPATNSWARGIAEFGYGNGHERTSVNYGANATGKHITTYFRTSFNVANKSQFSFFALKVYLDDGMVVFVNGKEVNRYNMPAGIVEYRTLASRDNPDNGNIITAFNIPIENFVNGTNTIAVEVHQASLDSEDLSFDLELTGISKDAAPIAIIRGPLLQMVSENAITITWRTNENASSRIQFGTSENSLASVVKDDILTKEHVMRITGLKPDTKYFYAVGSGSDIFEGSYRNFFNTSPLANTTRKIRIGVFGDAGTGDRTQKKGRDSYLQLFKKGVNAELAILLGDNAYNTGTDQEYQSNFFDIYDQNILNNHVVFPIPGNHEYASPGVPYFSVFSLPAAAESGGLASGTESYYSFNYGNIHFIMLNSMGNNDGKPLGDSTSEQAIWLKADLEQNAGTHKWTIACLHHPPYTNGTHYSDDEPRLIAIRQQLTPILERFGVDAVLAGHSHVYERSFLIQGHTGPSNSFKTSPPGTGNLVSGSSGRYDGSDNSCPYFTIDTIAKKGTVYVVAGSAGQIGGGTNGGMPLFYYKNYSGTSGGESGVLYLEVQDNRLDAKFIGLSGTVRDQFTIMKGVNTKKTITAEVNKQIDLSASWIGNYNWLPTPPSGTDGFKTLTLKPTSIGKFTYYVKDSIGLSKACISDTFEIRAFGPPTASSVLFEASKRYNSVLVKWSTENEADIDYFTIERSSNGRDFNMLTMIKPSAITNPATYQFEDNYPVRGNNYYRIIINYKNSQSAIMGVRIVNFEPVSSFTYVIQPNSSNSRLVNISIESARKQLLQINIYDMAGKIMYSNSLSATEGSNQVKVPLLPGMFVLNIGDQNNNHSTKKFTVR